MRRVLGRTALGMVVVFGLLQLVPYGWSHPNPPVTQAVTWPDEATESLARAACYDCHSNESKWPAYSYVAPASWLVRRDVEEGRAALNLSELDQGGGDELDDAAETIQEGSMPPRKFLLLHPDARLSDAEEQQLIAAFEQLAGSHERSDDAEEEEGEDEEDD
ncbi:MAG: heme-binding domain-containing protein [Acidimicrobiales bacterium]